jgi:hypothetical protein
MTTVQDEITRILLFLQDNDTSPANTANVLTQVQESVQQLAQRNFFPQILGVQAVAGTSTYTLPTTTADIRHVIYNEKALRYITEDAFDRKSAGWESLTGEPLYWTRDNLARNTIRVIPAPRRTGSLVPVFPPVPLLMTLTDNFVIFITEDPSTTLATPEDTMSTLLDYDDWIVYNAVQALALRETPNQNAPVAQAASQIANLWLELLSKEIHGGTQ